MDSNSTSNLTTSECATVLTWMHLFIVPLICISGLIGNSMAVLLIVNQTLLKRLPSNTYLLVMALVSSVFLIVTLIILLDGLISPLYGWIELYQGWQAGCKLLTYLGSCGDFACIWLIVCVSIDRVMFLYYPFKRKRLCSLANAKYTAGAVVAVSCLLNAWLLFLATLVESGEGSSTTCDVNENHLDLYDVFKWGETVLGIILPSILVLAANLAVIWRLRELAKGTAKWRSAHTLRLQNLQDHTICVETTNDNLNGTRTDGADASLFGDQSLNARGSRSDRSAALAKRQQEKQLTRSLIIVTTVLILLNLPNYLCRLFQKNVTDCTSYVLLYIAYWMYYCHHAVLFYVYVFNSKQMRKELKPTALKVLECYCLKTVPDFGHSTHTN